ncbi:hypothetical protein WR25_06785 [Diploscapter pachys]|uniref:Innexin n=1 Tax=Diploscapter pachys TaxID=2018661 RepID=A0A2A2KDY4_9BILA|nr:hypothetical protein WR25_06785 [Diploscapter pachys]
MFFLDAFLKGLKPQFDDDAVDRLNYYFTPMVLVIFSLTLSAKQYVGQPIQCWIPAQFTGAWEQYSENYCFVQNTYFVNPKEYVPDNIDDRKAAEIGYYQWVPFILGIQAILFYLPNLIWRMFNWHSGVAIKSIVKMAKDTSNMDVDKKKESVRVVGAHIHDAFSMQHKMAKQSRMTSFVYSGGYLSMLYLIVKLLYVVQVFMQLFLLNHILSPHYTLWGVGILMDVASGREWQESGHFPRVTMCDFEVRALANKQRYTLQCVLMINMFTEKVFVFVWFWLVFVLVVTIVNFFIWCRHIFSGEQRRESIAKYLRIFGYYDDDNVSTSRALNRFVNNKLRSDGVLVVKLISKNAGDIICADLIASLWEKHLDEEKQRSDAALTSPVSPQAPGLDDVDGFKEDLKRPLT